LHRKIIIHLLCQIIEKIKCLIIGSGPAGYTAAIYAAEPTQNLLYTKECSLVDNNHYKRSRKLARNPEGITGPEMMVGLQAQAQRFGTDA
jgi:thioredoxin reductase (NADPH)